MTMNKPISFKLDRDIRDALIDECKEKEDGILYPYIRGIVKNYVTTKKYANMDVRRSDIKSKKGKSKMPDSIRFTQDVFDLIEDKRDELGRSRGEFISMILIDYLKRLRK